MVSGSAGPAKPNAPELFYHFPAGPVNLDRLLRNPKLPDTIDQQRRQQEQLKEQAEAYQQEIRRLKALLKEKP